MTSSEHERAAEAIAACDALVVTAGAGMGVDSGLPDFRGPEGFWRAYPPYQKLGLAFEEVADPRWFVDDPALAWGFYGHRLNLYRATTPHDGFRVLREIAKPKFVFTSNVDGQFQRAGFDKVFEVHGAIEHFQCTATVHGIWPAGDAIDVDDATFRARAPLPVCPKCGALARPNILMFSDFGWLETRANDQSAQLDAWLRERGPRERVVVVECGAGPSIPTVRRFGENLVRRRAGATLIRINLRDPDIPDGVDGISIASGAKAALLAIESHLGAHRAG